MLSLLVVVILVFVPRAWWPWDDVHKNGNYNSLLEQNQWKDCYLPQMTWHSEKWWKAGLDWLTESVVELTNEFGLQCFDILDSHNKQKRYILIRGTWDTLTIFLYQCYYVEQINRMAVPILARFHLNIHFNNGPQPCSNDFYCTLSISKLFSIMNTKHNDNISSTLNIKHLS